jgi:hypothetical protein
MPRILRSCTKIRAVSRWQEMAIACRSKGPIPLHRMLGASGGGSEAQVHSAAVRFQREQRLCTKRMYKREKETNHAKSTFVNPFERGEIGPDLFRAAYRMGLEGLMSNTP